jgi:hypothetical protein
MDSLVALLSHKALVINAIASAVYKESTNAANQRMVSRKTRRHRFTYEEYMGLRRFGQKAVKWLRAQAEAATLPSAYPQWLSLKAILRVAANTDDEAVYFKWYDGLRQKAALSAEQQSAVLDAMLQLAEFVEQQLALADTEKKTYVFSTGRGGRKEKKD